MGSSRNSTIDSHGIHLPAGAATLLSLIVANAPVSRAELERLAGLSRATVVQRLGVLMATGLVGETDETAPSGGRPSRLLRLNEKFALTLAADIGETITRVVITTLRPEILAETTFPTHLENPPESVLTEIMTHGYRLLAEIQRPPSDLLGIGLSLPAPVDFARARVVGPSVMPGWDDFDIRAWFGDHHQIQVFADNDVNLMAVAEHREFWKDEDSFFFIKAGTGIGSGIVNEGRVFRGGQGAAGDIGHIQMDYPAPPLCRCGKLGCLEAYAAGWSLARTLRERGFDASDARDVISLARRNVPEAIQQIRAAGRALGEVAASVVSVLNPNRIVIGGTLALADEHLLAGVREQINQRCLPLATQKLAICTARSDDRAGVLGAARLVIEGRLHAADR